jgi:putative FmdB family regulatory protein
MPLFEYKCPHCDLVIEVIQNRESVAPVCAPCESRHQIRVQMGRQISRTNFSLKGSGWARDHYGLKEQ